MTCRITWGVDCPEPGSVHGTWHACTREDAHPGKHKCACDARSSVFLNPQPERERPERLFQRVPRRIRPSYVRRDPTHYWPKYLKRKRGIPDAGE